MKEEDTFRSPPRNQGCGRVGSGDGGDDDDDHGGGNGGGGDGGGGGDNAVRSQMWDKHLRKKRASIMSAAPVDAASLNAKFSNNDQVKAHPAAMGGKLSMRELNRKNAIKTKP